MLSFVLLSCLFTLLLFNPARLEAVVGVEGHQEVLPLPEERRELRVPRLRGFQGYCVTYTVKGPLFEETNTSITTPIIHRRISK